MACFERPLNLLNLFENNMISGPSVPTEHPGKISSGPTILFGVPGITGHTICRTLVTMLVATYKKILEVRPQLLSYLLPECMEAR